MHTKRHTDRKRKREGKADINTETGTERGGKDTCIQKEAGTDTQTQDTEKQK